MSQREKLQEKAKKVVVFICDGIVEAAYSTEPDLELVVVDYDRDRDDKDALDKLYDECISDPELQDHTPSIVHPGYEE